jgi:pantoate--beta-alanine ligase
MRVLRTREALLNWRKSLKPRHRLGFVPTMGALHAGHLSLIRRAQNECDRVVVSIFVNPTQFAPHEDFSKYPRPEKQDLALLRELNVDVAFLPKPSHIYSNFSGAKVLPRASLSQILEGKFRPGHFEGVATVVLKLFELVRPQRAYFGEKDFQQIRVIESMIEDFFLPVEIIRCKTIREKSGLALSSRNTYLAREDRLYAAQLLRIMKNSRDPRVAIRKLEKLGFTVDYLEVWEKNLRFKSKTSKGRWLAAARYGGVRLIDNILRT